MSRCHDNAAPKPIRVAEPVQVYLRADELERLARLTERLDTTESEVLRLGLEALERQLTDPAEHPALGIIGIAHGSTGGVAGTDVAREHDRVLADDRRRRGAKAAERGERVALRRHERLVSPCRQFACRPRADGSP